MEIEEIKNKIIDLEKLIIKRFDEIDKKLELICNNCKEDNSKMEEIKKECNKMGSHIDFIEDTYNTLQMPLNYVKKSIERLVGSSSKDLPMKKIEDKKN